ncbi:MAG: hypothetical protein OXR68_07620 [Alphaproteobacteria bacterium]|nr:hypothetical protein [Alphaproteobacteria bacterium]MDD9920472.1 hypothetical protein [Alphaproteobacteria bacterium]
MSVVERRQRSFNRPKRIKGLNVKEGEILLTPKASWALIRTLVATVAIVGASTAGWAWVAFAEQDPFNLIIAIVFALVGFGFLLFSVVEFLYPQSSYILLTAEGIKYHPLFSTKKFEIKWFDIVDIENYQTGGKNKQHYVRLKLRDGTNKDFNHGSILPVRELVDVIDQHWEEQTSKEPTAEELAALPKEQVFILDREKGQKVIAQLWLFTAVFFMEIPFFAFVLIPMFKGTSGFGPPLIMMIALLGFASIGFVYFLQLVLKKKRELDNAEETNVRLHENGFSYTKGGVQVLAVNWADVRSLDHSFCKGHNYTKAAIVVETHKGTEVIKPEVANILPLRELYQKMRLYWVRYKG